jgi:paraquat-inducible protein B
MNGDSPIQDAPTATTRKSRRIPLVWIVPVLTLAIGAWLAWDTFSKRGPTIVITFDTAAGLQAGQSQLKYKDVVMGTVKSIAVSEDLTRVVVAVETVREAERLITDKTVFWVVKPQLFAGRVSGLETLLSGSYIGMLPSTEPGKQQHQFIGKEDPPVLPSYVPGTVFHLQAGRVGSLSLGSPIFYRDLEVGTVLGWELGNMARHVTIHAFVRAPFDKYVHDDSLFWNASGVSVKLGPNGIKLQMESFRALLLGGVAFSTRPDTKAAISAPNHSFPLYGDHAAATSAGYGRRLHMLSYFEGSVAGLDVGADVTLHGLKIGEVTDVGLVYDPKLDRIMAPVRYQVEGERIAGIGGYRDVPDGVVAAEMVRRGFRATLQSTSLITGQKVVAIEYMPGAPTAQLTREGDQFVVPSSAVGGFDSLTQSASELLSKINRIDFDAIGKSIAGATKGVDDIVNGPQLKQTLASLDASMRSIQDFSRKLDTDAGPAIARLPEISRQLEDSLTRINRLAGSVDKAYGNESRFSRELDRLLPQLNDTARSIRALTDLLSRHPEALLKGRPAPGKE